MHVRDGADQVSLAQKAPMNRSAIATLPLVEPVSDELAEELQEVLDESANDRSQCQAYRSQSLSVRVSGIPRIAAPLSLGPTIGT